MYHAKIKHIDVRFHETRELVSSGELVLEKIHDVHAAFKMHPQKYLQNLLSMAARIKEEREREREKEKH